MRYRIPCGLLLALASVTWAQNLVPNGDLESDKLEWSGGGVSIDRAVFRGGRAALRFDNTAEGAAGSVRLTKKIDLNQKSPESLMASVWLRVKPRAAHGAIRGGMTIRLEFVDGTALYWYGPFQIPVEQMSDAWVYREGTCKPRSPVATATIALYLKNVEATLWADDITFGPPRALPAPEVRVTPVSVTGDRDRFTEWATFRVDLLRPEANVFHLSDENSANISFVCDYDVSRAAPIALNSAWGSQYWTLYHLGRREMCQIYTDERLDLSRKGKSQAVLPMNQWCDNAGPLAKGAYVLVTDYQKNFLIYGSDKPKDFVYQDPKTGAKSGYWDTVKLTRLKHMAGPEGIAAPFSAANLSSYKLTASARRRPGGEAGVVVEPLLIDADGDRVPLVGLDLAVRSPKGERLAAKELADRDGLPTGHYAVPYGGAGPVEIGANVSLMRPDGFKMARLGVSAPIEDAETVTRPAPAKLHLHGWCGMHHALASGAEDGPASMDRMVADAAKGGVGTLVVHAKSGHGCCFPSKIAPAAQQTPWDHMAAAVKAGKKHGVRIYAGYILAIAHKDDAKLHPDWAMIGPSGKPTHWYCYMNPEVRDYHARILKELAVNYDIDGVALDFCRPGGGCYCERCRALFQKKYGKPLKGIDPYDPEWGAWRREATTDYMRYLAKAVREVKPDLKFGGYVWSRIAMDRDRACQDFPLWLKEGTFDYVYMGNYRSSLPFFRAICHVCKRTADEHGIDPDRIIPMLGIAYIQQSHRHHPVNDAMLARQLDIVAEEGCAHAGLFSFAPCRVHLDTLRKHSADAR